MLLQCLVLVIIIINYKTGIFNFEMSFMYNVFICDNFFLVKSRFLADTDIGELTKQVMIRSL